MAGRSDPTPTLPGASTGRGSPGREPGKAAPRARVPVSPEGFPRPSLPTAPARPSTASGDRARCGAWCGGGGGRLVRLPSAVALRSSWRCAAPSARSYGCTARRLTGTGGAARREGNRPRTPDPGPPRVAAACPRPRFSPPWPSLAAPLLSLFAACSGHLCSPRPGAIGALGRPPPHRRPPRRSPRRPPLRRLPGGPTLAGARPGSLPGRVRSVARGAPPGQRPSPPPEPDHPADAVTSASRPPAQRTASAQARSSSERAPGSAATRCPSGRMTRTVWAAASG